MDDEKIIELYFARSENAISETDKKYGKNCRRTALNILRSEQDSEECVNDTYMRLWNVIPPQKPLPLCAFIMRIVRNIAIDMVKRYSAIKRGGEMYDTAYDELSECVPSRENVAEAAETAELTAEIEKFLGTLSREKKRIFLMRYWSFMTVAEIAENLGIGESKVKVTLMRTREKLKQFLEKEGIVL